ncbi:MAG: hypothetical protein ACOC3V_04745 [bacterium]
MEFTQEELKTLVIGIRLQIDESEKSKYHYDKDIRDLFNKKRDNLYHLWEKIENYGKE